MVVIDCDFQHSILKCRKSDLKRYGEEQIPYEVWSHEPNKSEDMISLIEKL
ncbi:ParA-related protein, partial [gut metagenome]